MDQPVVIAAFRAASEAVAARGVLVREGFDAEVIRRSDDLPRRCDDVFDGGFDLIVEDRDTGGAIDVLQRLWPELATTGRVVEQCPVCGSAEVSTLPRLLIFVSSAVLLLAGGLLTGQRDLFFLLIAVMGALLLLTPGRRCRQCGERWRRWPEAAPESDVEPPEILCPRCGSGETAAISRRREKAITLLVNLAIPPTIVVWPFLKRWRCSACGNEWR